MSITDQIDQLWSKALTDAIGCQHPEPFTYADEKVAHLRVQLRSIERAQQGVNRLRAGSRAGRLQQAARA